MSLPALAFVPISGDVASARRAGPRGRRGGPGPRARGQEPPAGERGEPAQVGGLAPRPRQARRPPAAARRPTWPRSRPRSAGSRRTRPSGSACSTSAWWRPSSRSRRAATSSPRPSCTSTPPSASRGSPCAGADGDPRGLFGPFRDRRAAEKARDALHRLFPLRPCDFAFEPDPALPLGLGLPLRAGALVRRALPRSRRRGGVPGARGAGRRLARGSGGPGDAPPAVPPVGRARRATLAPWSWTRGRRRSGSTPCAPGVSSTGRPSSCRPTTWSRRSRRLSLARGGWRRRLALARGLAAHPEGARLVRPRSRGCARARRRGARRASPALRRPAAGW